MIALYAIAWAGISMLFNYSTWKGGALESYCIFLMRLPLWIGKPLGLCCVCFGFWFGTVFYFSVKIGSVEQYLIFVGISEMILILYQLIFFKKND